MDQRADPVHDSQMAEADVSSASSPNSVRSFGSEMPLESMSTSPRTAAELVPDESVVPLSLINNLGASAGVMTTATQLLDADSSKLNSDDTAIPGWNRQDLRRAASSHQLYFKHHLTARKRDIGGTFEPLSADQAHMGPYMLER